MIRMIIKIISIMHEELLGVSFEKINDKASIFPSLNTRYVSVSPTSSHGEFTDRKKYLLKMKKAKQCIFLKKQIRTPLQKSLPSKKSDQNMAHLHFFQNKDKRQASKVNIGYYENYQKRYEVSKQKCKSFQEPQSLRSCKSQFIMAKKKKKNSLIKSSIQNLIKEQQSKEKALRQNIPVSQGVGDCNLIFGSIRERKRNAEEKSFEKGLNIRKAVKNIHQKINLPKVKKKIIQTIVKKNTFNDVSPPQQIIKSIEVRKIEPWDPYRQEEQQQFIFNIQVKQ